MHLQPLEHGMQGPTWFSRQGFVSALDFVLSWTTSPDVGVVCVEREAVFPHDLVRLRLLTVPSLCTQGNTLTGVSFKMGTGVSLVTAAALLSMPRATLLDTYRHFVAVMAASAGAIFGLPRTLDTVPGLRHGHYTTL